jgi:hypothetical protein
MLLKSITPQRDRFFGYSVIRFFGSRYRTATVRESVLWLPRGGGFPDA